MACVAGGLAYWGLSYLGVRLYITVIVAFCVVCAIRLLAVRYHISLPKLRDEEQTAVSYTHLDVYKRQVLQVVVVTTTSPAFSVCQV